MRWDVSPWGTQPKTLDASTNAKIQLIVNTGINQHMLICLPWPMPKSLVKEIYVCAKGIIATPSGSLVGRFLALSLVLLLQHFSYVAFCLLPVHFVKSKGRFFHKVMAKFFMLSKWHSCEPKIVPELLFPVHVVNKTLVLFWIHLVKSLLIMNYI